MISDCKHPPGSVVSQSAAGCSPSAPCTRCSLRTYCFPLGFMLIFNVSEFAVVVHLWFGFVKVFCAARHWLLSCSFQVAGKFSSSVSLPDSSSFMERLQIPFTSHTDAPFHFTCHKRCAWSPQTRRESDWLLRSTAFTFPWIPRINLLCGVKTWATGKKRQPVGSLFMLFLLLLLLFSKEPLQLSKYIILMCYNGNAHLTLWHLSKCKIIPSLSMSFKEQQITF